MATNRLMAFYADWHAANMQRPRYAPDERIQSQAGFTVARRLDEAFLDAASWPVDIYEVEILPEHVLAARVGRTLMEDDPRIQVRAFRVVRVVPQYEALGPRAQDISALLEELRNCAWLAPTPLSDARLGELVHAYYDTLHHSGTPAPPVLVTDWRRIRRLQLGIAGEPPRGPLRLDAAVFESFTRIAVHLAAFHIAYRSAWEAAWRVGAAAALAAAQGRCSEITEVEQWLTCAHRELAAAWDTSPLPAWETSLRVTSTPPRAPLFARHSETLQRISNLRKLLWLAEPELLELWGVVSTFAEAVPAAIAAVATAWITRPHEPPPAAPLVEMFRRGLWPLGESRGRFLIFAPVAST